MRAAAFDRLRLSGLVMTGGAGAIAMTFGW